jgi:hypothetical protein
MDDGNVLTDESRDAIVAALQEASEALSELNEQMVNLVVALDNVLHAGAVPGLASYREPLPKPDAAAPPDTF